MTTLNLLRSPLKTARKLLDVYKRQGTEVIFAAAGGAGGSVMKAAEEKQNKWVIGVDVDQRAESRTVLTSAIKSLGSSVYQLSLIHI